MTPVDSYVGSVVTVPPSQVWGASSDFAPQAHSCQWLVPSETHSSPKLWPLAGTSTVLVWGAAH